MDRTPGPHTPTPTRRRRLVAAASVALLVGGLAACGGDDDDTDTDAGTDAQQGAEGTEGLGSD